MWHILTSLLYLTYANGHLAPHGYQPDHYDVSALQQDREISRLRPQRYHKLSTSYQKEQNPFLEFTSFLKEPFSDLSHPKGQSSPKTHPYIAAIDRLIEKYQNPNPNTHPKYIPLPGFLSRSNLKSKVADKTINYLSGNFFNLESLPSGVAEQLAYALRWDLPNQHVHLVVDDVLTVEKFGKYLLARTEVGLKPTASYNDAARQYNALFLVLAALVREIRSYCSDFGEVYEQVYQATIDAVYPDAVQTAQYLPYFIIKYYIGRANDELSKIKKAIQETCRRDLYCAEAVERKVKSSPLVFGKELETLRALSKLARSFQGFDVEFNMAAQKGIAYHYLKTSKGRLKDYVMHLVNSIDHLTGKPSECSSNRVL